MGGSALAHVRVHECGANADGIAQGNQYDSTDVYADGDPDTDANADANADGHAGNGGDGVANTDGDAPARRDGDADPDANV